MLPYPKAELFISENATYVLLTICKFHVRFNWLKRRYELSLLSFLSIAFASNSGYCIWFAVGASEEIGTHFYDTIFFLL